ncbi:hypothetical protein ES319_D11G221000v1 [Gossypium barbadense]|uniref:Uncharacterized protein n=1 Tax=Gossypium barbadense TaxID=3634 RepID=A0A5J5PFE7_GOSBA|nr:hypothetical protein ES319_D11G221000v1 [Gossypium barbadense]
MSKPNGPLVSFVFLLVFSSIFSPKLVFGSIPVHERIIKRPDPLRHLKHYNDVFNVTNKHYWASTAFTGIHGYAMAGVWTLCGVYLGIFMIFKNSIASNESSSSWLTVHSDRYFLLLFILFLLLTLFAIIAASFVIAANQISQHRTKKLKNTLVKAGHEVTQSIRRLITKMTRMQYLLLPYDQKTSSRLNVTTHRLGRESRKIRNFVRNHEHSLDVAIQVPYIAHLGIASVNLLLLVAALVLFLLHWQPGLIFIIVFCWILTALCWVLTGFDFFLHIFAEDTCSTFEDFVQEPYNNSLSSLLPCMSSKKSEKILTEIGSTIHDFIGKLNSKITEVCTTMGLSEENFEMLGFKMICDPFSGAPDFNYEPGDCAKDAIPIGKIPDIISKFTCYKQNSTEACLENGKFLTEDASNKALAYSYTIESMLDVYPDLQSLTECTMVKNTFSEISLNQCKPFRSSLLWQWASILSLSISMVFLVFTLILKAYQQRGRNFSICSIFPNRSNSVNVENQNVQ